MDSMTSYMAAYQKASETFVDADWTHEFLLSLDADPNDHGWDPDDGQDICDGTRPCQTCIDVAVDAVACEEQAADAVAAADRGDWAAAISAANEAAEIENKWGDDPTWRPFAEAIAVAAAESLGRECAIEALDAGGSDPTDEAGRCLLPPGPIGGDWAELTNQYDGGVVEVSREAEDAFEEAFRNVMGPAIERVEAGILLVRVVEVRDTTDLYCCHDGRDGEQPCVVELECENGALSADYLVDSGTTPGEVWHGLTQQWGIPLLTADTANALMHRIAPLAQKVLDGYEEIWDGSNHVGRLTEAASAASDKIERMCDVVTGDMVVEYASDWFRSCTPADIGVTTDSTDADLEQVAADALEYAGGDVHVIHGAEEFLREMRDDLRDERDAEREER